MFKISWNPADRVIGPMIGIIGLFISLLNSVSFAQQAALYDAWWVLLCLVVPLAVALTILGFRELSDRALRLLWLVAPALLFACLALTYLAWNGSGGGVPFPKIWLLDGVVLSALALVIRLRFVLAATFALAASVPLSEFLFIGQVSPEVASWGLERGASFVFVLITLVLRRQLIQLAQTQTLTKRLRGEEARRVAQSQSFDRFARMIHDDVLSTFASALHLSGDVPALLRNSADVALNALEVDVEVPVTIEDPIEIDSQASAQLICELIRGGSERFEVSSVVLDGSVSYAAVRSIGLAAAEAARNAERHAGGGSADVVVENNSIRVTIADQGHGFDTARLPEARFGISDSILGRLEELVGANSTIDSGPMGTRVVLTWNRSEK